MFKVHSLSVNLRRKIFEKNDLKTRIGIAKDGQIFREDLAFRCAQESLLLLCPIRAGIDHVHKNYVDFLKVRLGFLSSTHF